MGSHGAGNQGGDYAGHQSGIVHDAHAYHLHGEDGRRHGRPEEGGKGGAHAAHGHDVPVLLIEAEPSADGAPDAAAQLQRGALPAGGAAQQMGDQGGEENQRRHAQGQPVAGMDGGEHQVRSAVLFMLEQVVSAYDKEAAEGQQPDEPGALRPGLGDARQAEVEEGAHNPYCGSRNGGEDNPFQGDFQLLQIFQEPVSFLHGRIRPFLLSL